MEFLVLEPENSIKNFFIIDLTYTNTVVLTLCSVVQERRSELESSHDLHRFLADYRDLVSWMSDIRALIAADDLAKDVPGAEALLERHQEHKVRFRPTPRECTEGLISHPNEMIERKKINLFYLSSSWR